MKEETKKTARKRAATIGKIVIGFFNIDRGQARHNKLRKRILDDAAIDGIHICQLAAAMIIASIGLNINSTEAVIGAMLICPIMGSVLAMAYSISSVDRKIFRQASIALLVQILICLATSTIYFVISPLSHRTTVLLSNTAPTVWDVLIAFVGGFAGALGTSRRQEPATLIAGVAVATALMPPLCTTGFGLADRDLLLALSAFYEFLINVVFIMFGSELVFVWIHVPLHRDLNGDGLVSEEEDREARRRSKVLRRKVVVGSLIFAIPCVFFSVQMVRSAMAENGTTFEVHDDYSTEYTARELKILYPDFVNYRVGSEDSFDFETETIQQRVVATVMTSSEPTESQKNDITNLVRLNSKDIDEVQFEIVKPGEGSSGQVQTTSQMSAGQPNAGQANTDQQAQSASESPPSDTQAASEGRAA